MIAAPDPNKRPMAETMRETYMSSALDAATARWPAMRTRQVPTRPAVTVVVPHPQRGGQHRAADGCASRGVLPGHGLEVIFVDDSDDGTDAVVRGA